jgi:hypothetical protein
MSTGPPHAPRLWRKLPSDRRHKLIVLVGQLALRRLHAAAAAKEAEHDLSTRPDISSTGQDPRSPS